MLNAGKTKPSLRQDESGALLIIGVVMGMILVGALWHVASIGDAIIWRERAQDAADSAAFENAVWNARGMNAIVLLNMLMALVMAVLVAWRALLLFVAVVIAVISLLCAVNFIVPNPLSAVACTLARSLPSMTQLLARMEKADTRIAENVVLITHALGTAQKVVAGAVPPVGALVSINDTKDAYDTAAVWTFSTSVIPNIESGIRLGVGKNPGFECDERQDNYSARDFLSARIGYGFSLPVQDEQYSVLCQKAGELVPNNLRAVLERAGAPGELVAAFGTLSTIAGAVAGSFPTVFCAPGATRIPDQVKSLMDGVAKDRCTEEEKQSRVFIADSTGETEAKYRKPDPDKPGEFLVGQYVDKFDTDDCMRRQAKQAGMKTVNRRKPTCSRPVKVWDYAANGNIAMQSFSFVDKEWPFLERDDSGLEITDGSQTGNLKSVDRPWIRAQAEMYYDCNTAWEACRTHAMWTLNWRARLRRIQRIEDMAARLGERVLVESLINGVYKIVGRATKNALSKRGVPDILSENARDTWLTTRVRNAARAGAYWSVGGRLFANPPSNPTVIH